MKSGQLFEYALRKARIKLKPGIELNIKVQGKGRKLRIVVRPSGISEFEASILERTKTSFDNLKPYNPKMAIGKRVRTLRKAAGMTLEAVALKAEMTKGSLCSIEKGERPCGLTVARKIGKALGVSVTVLVE